MMPATVKGQASHQRTEGCTAVTPAAQKIPASSGQGGTPMPVRKSQKKIDAYQNAASRNKVRLLSPRAAFTRALKRHQFPCQRAIRRDGVEVLGSWERMRWRR